MSTLAVVSHVNTTPTLAGLRAALDVEKARVPRRLVIDHDGADGT